MAAIIVNVKNRVSYETLTFSLKDFGPFGFFGSCTAAGGGTTTCGVVTPIDGATRFGVGPPTAGTSFANPPNPRERRGCTTCGGVGGGG